MVIPLVENSFTINCLIKEGISESEAIDIENQLGLNAKKRTENIDFVGLIETPSRRFFSLPKFCSHSNERESRLIVETLRRIASDQALINRFPDAYLFDRKQASESLSKLDIAEILLEDFYCHGLLSIRRSFYKPSTHRTADWGKTIDSIYPVWSDGQPIYGKWVSKHSEQSEHRLLTEIHRAVIADCAACYGTLLGFESSLHVDKVGLPVTPKHASILAKSALRRTYSLREINVLHALIAWLEEEREGGAAFFGTRHFNLVWQTVCSYLLNDIKDANPWKGLMPKPVWRIWDNSEKCLPQGGFLLDCLTELPREFGMLLSDAKYYVPSFSEESAHGVPGMESLSKQLHYAQLLFSSTPFNKLFKNNPSKIINAFIFPGQKDSKIIWPFADVTIPRIENERIICIYLSGLTALYRFTRRRTFNQEELATLCGLIASIPP